MGPEHSYTMPLWWPFRRREPVDTGFEEVGYTGEEDTEDTLADRSHVESEEFQNAMAILTASTETAPAGEPAPKPGEGEGGWVDNNDGYWYWKKADGTFDPTPHIKRPDGSMEPYTG